MLTDSWTSADHRRRCCCCRCTRLRAGCAAAARPPPGPARCRATAGDPATNNLVAASPRPSLSPPAPPPWPACSAAVSPRRRAAGRPACAPMAAAASRPVARHVPTRPPRASRPPAGEKSLGIAGDMVEQARGGGGHRGQQQRLGRASRRSPTDPQATAETLQGPDWGVIIGLCDLINQDMECAARGVGQASSPARPLTRPLAPPSRPPPPPFARSNGKDAAKAMRKRLTTGSPKAQLLCLTARAGGARPHARLCGCMPRHIAPLPLTRPPPCPPSCSRRA